MHEKEATKQLPNKDTQKMRDVTYTVCSENIEATVRLLSCNKAVTLIEKDGIKKARTLITSQAS